VGDVNSTLAGAEVANELKIKVAHIESGLRSFDRTMPEENNRIATDKITDYFFVTEQSGIDNLLKEGKAADRIYFVGNTMIDTIVAYKEQIESSDVLSKLNIESNKFILMTMHRPATVDVKDGLIKLIELIQSIAGAYKIVFPVHPRTMKRLAEFNLGQIFFENSNLIVTEPLDYFSFQKLIRESKLIITDSGGIQEESTFLKIPCLTLRANTERPSTVAVGTNELIPFDLPIVLKKVKEIEEGAFKKGVIPEKWDGHATQRIVDVLLKIFSE
jgi:UDP-N-acetylglucosamine 2-epimerase (non-hydrolysing)